MTGYAAMQKYYELTEKIWRDLCIIPSPSYHEEKRAEYIKNLLFSWGVDAEFDEVKNVIVKIDGKEKDTVVFAAHIDTVFYDLEVIPFHETEEKAYCPGCGDDAVSVAMLMAAIKYIKDSGKTPQNTILIAFDSCEEGVGSLKGIRTVMKKYGKDVIAFYTFDGTYDEVANVSVRERRYRVTVKAEGGHSYSDFGNKSAAEILSRGISRIYDIDAPQDKGKTTYNVGVISGGNAVNAIAAQAEMLCEYRSISRESLEYMQDRFFEIFEYMRALGGEVTVELIDDRPGIEGVDEKRQRELTDFCKTVQEKYSGIKPSECSASTDCNIPHSMGIPAVCVGTYMGGGIHSEEEWLEKKSIPIGFDITREVVMHYFE